MKKNTHYDFYYEFPDREEKVVCNCDICSEPIYAYELVHLIDGHIVCPDCFFDFAFDYFSDRLVKASELGGE